jgi:hypothetical protein
MRKFKSWIMGFTNQHSQHTFLQQYSIHFYNNTKYNFTTIQYTISKEWKF